MRPPRYKFPNEVRETTRTIASRMVQEGTIARTPEELDAWIAKEPDLRLTLERGGYSTAFTSNDLFPLLEVFLVQREGPPPVPDAPLRSSTRWWVLGILLVLALVLVFFFVGAVVQSPAS